MGGWVEAGGNTNHTQMGASRLPGWPGATGSALSTSWMPGVSWAGHTQAGSSPCLLAAIPSLG